MTTKAEALVEIRGAGERLHASCASAPEPHWRFQPEPDAWSMAHVAEHVTLSNRGILARLEKLLDAPLVRRAADVLDLEIPYLFYRAEEPPHVGRPTGTWTERAPALDRVAESWQRILAWADATDADLRRVGAPHPVFGLLDGVQWLLFAAAHMERHRAQVIGLRALPGYPE